MAENMCDDHTRMGRFRICAPNSPEPMSHGRFRIIPQGNTIPILGIVYIG